MSAQHRAGLHKQCGCPLAEQAKCHTRGRGHGYHYQRRVTVDGRSVQRAWSLNKWLTDRRDPRVITTRREADAIVIEIDAAILAGTHDQRVAPASTTTTASTAALTFAQLCARFITMLQGTEIDSWTNEQGMLNRLARVDVPDHGRLATLPIDQLHSDLIEQIYRSTARYAPGTRKKYRRVLRRVCRWAVQKKWLQASPITDDTTLPTGKEISRQRRVRQAELDDLIEAAREGRSDAAERLAVLILAAVETGCRRGELLAIKYGDLVWDDARIVIRAIERGARKTKKSRVVPFTPLLQAAIAALPASPTGAAWPNAAYVFGDAIGGRVRSVRKAWDTAVLRAHRHDPQWTKSGGSLKPASRKALAAIDLHFHDLRHEAALRWHEAGLPLAAIAKLLGHADLALLAVYLGIDFDDALAAHAALAARPAAPPAAPPAASGGGKTRQNGGKTVVKPNVLTFERGRKSG